MARGIQAVAMLICIVLAVSLMAQLGAYEAVDGGQYATTGSEDDVNRIIAAVEEPSGSITGVAAIDPFLSLAIGALDTLQIFWIIVSDTSELVLLLGAGEAIANTVESMVRFAFGLVMIYMARGVVL